MVVVPADCPVATPATLIVATLGLDDAQVTYGLKYCVLPSVKVPTALYCSPEAGANTAEAGVNRMDASVAVLTVSEAVPVALAPAAVKLALTVTAPEAIPVASPKLPDVFPTVAVPGALELHPTTVEISCDDESLNVPVAWKMACPPIGMVIGEGAIEIETIVALVTLNGTEVVTEPRFAVMVTRPGARPRNSPLLPPIFATVGSEEIQVTSPVMLRVLPSLKVPIAAS